MCYKDNGERFYSWSRLDTSFCIDHHWSEKQPEKHWLANERPQDTRLWHMMNWGMQVYLYKFQVWKFFKSVVCITQHLLKNRNILDFARSIQPPLPRPGAHWCPPPADHGLQTLLQPFCVCACVCGGGRGAPPYHS
jgi:hypothetical protein